MFNQGEVLNTVMKHLVYCAIDCYYTCYTVHIETRVMLLHISLCTIVITSIPGLRCRGKRICELVDTYFHASRFPGTTGPNKCGFLLCLGD